MEQPFGFPFKPYSIQTDLVTDLVATIRQRRSGVFESPTGTVSYSNLQRSYLRKTRLNPLTPVCIPRNFRARR